MATAGVAGASPTPLSGSLGDYRIEVSAGPASVHVALVGRRTPEARRHVAEVCAAVAACGLRVELVGI